MPRPAGQALAGVRFQAGFLGQTQATPARHIRTMNIKSFMVLSSSVHGFTFRVALLGAALTVSCGLGASGSGIARSPSPSDLDRSSGSKRPLPSPPIDSPCYVVGWLAWSNSSRCSRSAFTTTYTVQSSMKTAQYLVSMGAIPLIYRGLREAKVIPTPKPETE